MVSALANTNTVGFSSILTPHNIGPDQLRRCVLPSDANWAAARGRLSPSRVSARGHRAYLGSAASIDAGRSRGTPGAARPCAGALSSAPRLDVGPGSPFSLLQVHQHGDVQRLFGDNLLQSHVLLLKSLEALCLVFLQCPVVEAPTEERLVGDLQALAHLGDRQTLRLELLGFSQARHDLLDGLSLPLHGSPPISLSERPGLTLEVDRNMGGRTV